MPCTNVTLFFGNVPPPKKKKVPYTAPPVRALPSRAGCPLFSALVFQMMQLVVLAVLRDMVEGGSERERWVRLGSNG